MNPALQQRREALAVANQVRMKRKETREKLESIGRRPGLKLLAQLVLTPRPELLSCPLSRLLTFPYGVGDAASKKILARARLKGNRTLGSLQPIEKQRLARELLRQTLHRSRR